MTTAGTRPLERIWLDEDLLQPCCVCSLQIDSGAVVRTFSLSRPEREPPLMDSIKTISFDGETLKIHNRHLECMSNVPYVTVSHVWEKEISRAQYLRNWSAEAEYIAFKAPLRIYKALQAQIEGDLELWHDYISIPQWHNGVKTRTLTSIPTIFGTGQTTVVHLEDMSVNTIHEMRHDEASIVRLMAMTKFLEAQWFWRVWTTLELFRSSQLWILTSDGELMQDGTNLLVHELHRRWSEECGHLGDARNAERMCGVNERWVVFPFHLGPMEQLRSNRGVTLGSAYDALFDRSCTIKSDIFTALLGITRHDDKESELSRDYSVACLQVARRCLREGDYSPVLLAPAEDDPEFPEARWLRIHQDDSRNFLTWRLGEQTSPPLFPPKLQDGHPLLTLEKVGRIQNAENLDIYVTDLIIPFLYIVKKALKFTGLDYKEFVRTVATRIFGQDTDEVLEYLSITGQLEEVHKILEELLNDQLSTEHSKRRAQTLAEAMALFPFTQNILKKGIGSYESPLGHAQNEGGNTHLAQSAGLISVTCGTCNKNSLFRAALYPNPSVYAGAILYRIPGLKYHNSLKDGMGIIINNQCIIGRLVYGCHACPCREEFEEVQLI